MFYILTCWTDCQSNGSTYDYIPLQLVIDSVPHEIKRAQKCCLLSPCSRKAFESLLFICQHTFLLQIFSLYFSGGFCQQICGRRGHKYRSGSGGDPVPHKSRADRFSPFHRSAGWQWMSDNYRSVVKNTRRSTMPGVCELTTRTQTNLCLSSQTQQRLQL